MQSFSVQDRPANSKNMTSRWRCVIFSVSFGTTNARHFSIFWHWLDRNLLWCCRMHRVQWFGGFPYPVRRSEAFDSAETRVDRFRPWRCHPLAWHSWVSPTLCWARQCSAFILMASVTNSNCKNAMVLRRGHCTVCGPNGKMNVKVQTLMKTCWKTFMTRWKKMAFLSRIWRVWTGILESRVEKTWDMLWNGTAGVFQEGLADAWWVHEQMLQGGQSMFSLLRQESDIPGDLSHFHCFSLRDSEGRATRVMVAWRLGRCLGRSQPAQAVLLQVAPYLLGCATLRRKFP